MRSVVFAAAICAMGLVSAGTALADNTSAPTMQPIAVKQDTNPVTCHFQPNQGDLVRGECHTQHQWEAIRRRDQETFREMQYRSMESHN